VTHALKILIYKKNLTDTYLITKSSNEVPTGEMEKLKLIINQRIRELEDAKVINQSNKYMLGVHECQGGINELEFVLIEISKLEE